jgi:serine/threonine protein kinase
MSAEAVRQLERGDRFDRYEVLALIASGGMGSVYLGQSYGAAGFRRYVAIKRMHPQFAADPRVGDMFLDEAHIAARIRHPNVVSTLDFGESPFGFYLVLDFVEGPSLLRVLEECRRAREPVPLPIALRILLDVLEGLGAAHSLTNERGEAMNIVHRDVSPHNVLVGADGITRVTDFGIARASMRVSETRVGEVKGKFAYFAPEQALGAPVDARTDLFAAAIVLWELIAGRKLFAGKTDYEIALQVVSGPIPDVREARPDVPAALADVLQRALERSIESRFGSAAELSDALSAAAESIGVATARSVAAFVERFGAKVLQPLRAAMLESADRVTPSPELSVRPASSGAQPRIDSGVTPARSMGGIFPAPPPPPSVSELDTGLRARPLPAPAVFAIRGPSLTPPTVPSPTARWSEVPYTTAFQLGELPFREVREPERFWYAGPFAETSDALLAAAEQSSAPIALVGAPGSGRTFLLEMQARRVHASRALVVNPTFLLGQSVAHAAAIELGVPLDPSMPPAVAFDALLQLVLRSQSELSALFFCVDGLPADSEPLRAELLPIVRSAPPWVRFVVATEPGRSHEAAPICARAVTLRPMSADEVRAFVEQGLARVANGPLPPFDPAVFPFLHARSGGAVRTVGVFVHNALQVAACLGASGVTIDAMRIAMKSRVPLSPSDALALIAREAR